MFQYQFCRSPRRLAFFGAAIMLALPFPQGLADDELVLRSMLECWKARQDSVPAALIEWEERTINQAEQSSSKLELLLGRDGMTRLSSTKADGSKDTWSFDGKRNYSLSPAENDEDWDRGIVRSDERNSEITNIQLRPWLIHFRPLSGPYPGFTKANLSIRSPRVKLRGVECCLVEMKYDADPIVGLYWVDTRRDCTILRFAETLRDKTLVELNIRYREDADCGWIPMSWDAAFTNGQFSLAASDSSVEFPVSAPSSEFAIDFPTNAVVFDHDAGYRYMLKKSGEKRRITDEESAFGFTRSELIATDSGDLAPGNRSGWAKLRIPVILGLIVVVCLVWFVRGKN